MAADAVPWRGLTDRLFGLVQARQAVIAMSKKKQQDMPDIPVIDLFAGPGGLGEGFSSFSVPSVSRHHPFQIRLSVEKDDHANRTLRFRSFFRKLGDDDQRGVLERLAKSDDPEGEELQRIYDEWPEQAAESSAEVLADRSSSERELGSDGLPPEFLDGIIRERLGGAKKWVLVGGPPCQAYSLVGRSKIRSLKKEKFEDDARHYLYKQYLRILETHKPPVFVMENVKGLLSSTIKGKRIVDQILKDLASAKGQEEVGYRLFPFVRREQTDFGFKGTVSPTDFIIRAEQHCIPQQRHRVIILGIREDIDVEPDYLVPDEGKITFEDVTKDLPPIRSRLSRRKGRSSSSSSGAWAVKWAESITGLKKRLTGSENKKLRKYIERRLNGVLTELRPGQPVMRYKQGGVPRLIKEYYRQLGSRYLFHHECKAHMASDLQRYFFYACYAEWSGTTGVARSPKLEDLPPRLLPKHRNINPDQPDSTPHKDRFRVQLKGAPASTIVSHLSKDGHAFIHPDPIQCRSLSIREAARMQTFPDDYVFWGGNSARYHQVGNAVPPLLARKLAGVVFGILESWS